MTQSLRVYIEIEQYSNQKYEWNKNTNTLDIDRVLPYPYFYPFSYGFIENTLAEDGDELDALILTNDPIERDKRYSVYPVGVLIMKDEKGMDEKVLCVLEKDYGQIQDITDISQTDLDNIRWFFSNYKSSTPGKWSQVYSFENREHALKIYSQSKIQP